MKKLLLVILFVVLSASLYAQNFVGTWTMTQTESDDKEGVEMMVKETLVLSSDQKMADSAVITIKVGKSDDDSIVLTLSFDGTWSYADNVLTQKYDANTIKSEITQKPDGMPKMILNMLTKGIVSEFKKQAKKPQQGKVLSASDNEFTIQEIGEKNPETNTYTRAK